MLISAERLSPKGNEVCMTKHQFTKEPDERKLSSPVLETRGFRERLSEFNPESWKSSGKRIKRGLYRTAQGWLANADCNAAANILRKVGTKLGIALGGVSRVTLTAPKRFPIWERGDVASAFG